MLNKLFTWYGKKTVFSIIILIVALLIFILSNTKDEAATDLTIETPRISEVTVSTLASLNNSNQISFLGEVKALSEVELKPEISGKITKANISLGQEVRAGQILVEIDNATERASLLQAEGAYEMALANSEQTNVSLSEAEINLEDAVQTVRNTNLSSYNSAKNVVLGSIDLFFSQPDTQTPGLKIGGKGSTDYLNAARVNLQTDLPNWYEKINKAGDTETELLSNRESRIQILKIQDIINTLIPLLNNENSVKGYSDLEIENLRTNLTSAQTQMTSTLNLLDKVYTDLKNAKENIEKTKLSVSGNSVSVSDAQIKQALGNLRSAQARYEKTLLRSPINGTVNSVSVKVGEFLNALEPIAKIANNSNSEIIAFVNEKELEQINIGDDVTIEVDSKGKIAIIAPVLDSDTKKTEIRIAVDSQDIAIGETVRIFHTRTQKADNSNIELFLPLTAIKFENTSAFIFKVEDGRLIKVPVIIGEVRGKNIQILSELDTNTEFVVDVRGKNENDLVSVLKK